jgi:hypothetical protein
MVEPSAAQIHKVDDVSIENLIDASKVAVATLDQLGQPMSAEDKTALAAAWGMSGDAASGKIQDILDRYCLLEVRIDEEAWLKANAASLDPADRRLVKGKWKAFLVKVYNQSAVSAPINVRSPQSISLDELKKAESGNLGNSDRQSWYRWLGLQIYPPAITPKNFAGSTLSYLVLGLYSRDEGMRAADLEFYFGGGAVSQGHYVNKRLLFDIDGSSK